MQNSLEHDQLTLARKYIKQNKLSKANYFVCKAIEKQPDNPEAFNLLGIIREKKGDFEGACRMYRAALALNPSYVPSQINLHRMTKVATDVGSYDLGIEFSREGVESVTGKPP